jgi:hypothetical protein
MHFEKLHNLNSSPNIIWVIKSVTTISENSTRISPTGDTYKVLVGKSEANVLLGITRRRWYDKFKNKF